MEWNILGMDKKKVNNIIIKWKMYLKNDIVGWEDRRCFVLE